MAIWLSRALLDGAPIHGRDSRVAGVALTRRNRSGGGMRRGGNGLGLFIASKVIDKLHGRMEITSELDKGTVVMLELPRHAS